jgi:predicted hotdog family 3-hydroxylacyl-ACP dehydratase
MPSALGIDWATEMAGIFGGDLYDCTFVKGTPGGVDPSNPNGRPLDTTATYRCKGIAFSYDIQQIDGEHVTQADYAVMILLGTIEAVLDDAVKATLDLGGETLNVDTVARARAAGATGNTITMELVDDAIAQAGTIVEVGSNVRIGFLSGSTTVADIEALLAGSTLLEVGTAGTGANVLAVGDAFAAVALAGGSDATSAPVTGVVPGPLDDVTIPPPNQTTNKTAVVIGVDAITQAAVTVQVRGEHL